MLNVTLRPGERLDGKSHKFTAMADANRKKKSNSTNPYDTQWKYRTAGTGDRTFQIPSRQLNKTQPARSTAPINHFPEGPPRQQTADMQDQDPPPLRPSTVDPLEIRQEDRDFAQSAGRSARPATVGFGTLSSTGAFDGPYHVSPSRIRPTTKFTAGHDFFAATAEIEKPETMFSTTFLNNNDVKDIVLSKTEEDFMEGFNCFVDFNGASVSVFDVEEIVKKVLGENIPRWIIEIFVVMCRNKSEYRRVKLADFRRIVPVALKAVNSYFQHSKMGPAWMKKEHMKSVRQPLMATAYHDDFEKPKNTWYSTKFPMTSDIKKSTQSVSNQMLFRGTTKATLHIPGYVGHIPTNRAIPHKEVHCNGESAHPPNYNLTLTYPVLGRLPGYVGHIPSFPVNQRKKK